MGPMLGSVRALAHCGKFPQSIVGEGTLVSLLPTEAVNENSSHHRKNFLWRERALPGARSDRATA